MLLLKRPGFELETTSPVVKGEEYAVMLEASQLLDAARERAAAIEAAAVEAAAKQKEEGYRQGMDEAREEMAVQMFEMIERTATYLEKVEGEVVGLVINSLKHILAQLPRDEIIVQTVRKALASIMRNQKQVTLRVSHEEVDKVRARTDELLADFPGIATIDVTPDSRLSGSDCILETDVGVVEASASVQLRALEAVLRKSLRKDD